VLTVAGLLGALFLVIATIATVIEVRVGTASHLTGVDGAGSGWERHGPALVLLAILGVLALGAALRGSRVGMAAVAAAGLAALVIALVSDARALHDPGVAGEVYDEASAGPGAGYYLETAGGVALLLAGGGLLLSPAPRSTRTARTGHPTSSRRPSPARR
jgi:hypothetical protein